MWSVAGSRESPASAYNRPKVLSAAGLLHGLLEAPCRFLWRTQEVKASSSGLYSLQSTLPEGGGQVRKLPVDVSQE